MRRFISSLTISVALIFGLSQVAFSEELTKQQIEAIEKKAFAGNAEAQFNLGVLYGEGLGVRQDASTAKNWFGTACDNGNQDGCDAYRELNEAGF